ncbi:MAG: PEP/pyruvate-binding domain-containing protein [Candidatus Parvarchaeum sp.]
MKYIVPCSGRGSRKTVGGKGAALLKLYKNGFNVPPFFILNVSMVNMLDDLKTCEAFRYKIKEAYKNIIRSGKVSVRSSATIEDMDNLSLAGQFKTVLNINMNNICDSIIDVRSSTDIARATYALKEKRNTKIKLAIIVQKMINPEKAGVLFTVDPVSMDKNIMVIEVAAGLGEIVVTGAKIPSRYYISKKDCKVFNSTYNKLLTENELKQLYDTALLIEKLFGYPQDIEFAIGGGKVYILQSRDITTL